MSNRIRAYCLSTQSNSSYLEPLELSLMFHKNERKCNNSRVLIYAPFVVPCSMTHSLPLQEGLPIPNEHKMSTKKKRKILSLDP